MTRLTVFDEGDPIGSVTVAGGTLLTFARSRTEWQTLARWVRQGFYLDEGGEDHVKVDPGDPRFLTMLAARAHEHGFSTELSAEEDEGG